MTSIIPVLALLVSGFALTISALTYYHNLPTAVLKRDQDAQMRQIAHQAYLIHFQYGFILRILDAEGAKAAKNEYAESLLNSLRRNAAVLTQHIDQGVGLGLIEELQGKHDASTILFSDFRAALLEVIEGGESSTLTKEEIWDRRVILGLYRLLDQCLKYRTPLLPASIRNHLSPILDQYRGQAWHDAKAED